MHSPLRPLLNVLRVRKWLIVLTVILVPLIAVGLSLSQQKRYRAASQVLISRTNLGNVLTGTQDPTATEFDFNRVIQTQARLARTARVGERTVQAAGIKGLTPAAFLNQATVATDPNTDILSLAVSDRERDRAIRLASEYARQFVAYSQGLTGNQLLVAEAQLTRQLATLPPNSALAQQDRAELARIRNLQSLGNSSVSVVQTARTAEQTQPKPVRSGILGLGLGLVIGIALAFGVDLLDTRVRVGSEVEERLGLTLLARLPAPPKPLRNANRLAMLADPSSPHAESFRVLRTALRFASLDHVVHTVVVTSAIESEGKSTTAGNLAIALAQSGRHVILADFDFRRPSIDRFFEMPRELGATTVIMGGATLDQVLRSIPVEAPAHTPSVGGNGRGRTGGLRGEGAGRLEVLATGELPPAVGDFITSDSVAQLIARLRDRADVLILDTPPLLQIGDTLAISAHADSILLVARLGVVRRAMLAEVTRLVATSPARAIGVVVTDATMEPGSGYDYYSYGDYGQPSAPAVSLPS